MKRRATLFLSLILLVAMFASCSGPASISNATANTLTEFEASMFEDESLQYFTDHKVAEGMPVTLTMWVNEDWLESYEFLLQEYKKYRPNVTVELTTFPWKTYWAKMRIVMQDGTGPDIFHMHNGFFADFSPYLKPLPAELFGEQALNGIFGDAAVPAENGQQYCVNLGRSTGGIFYNKRMWWEAGLTEADIPQTWDELQKVAKRLTQYNAAGEIIIDGFNFNEEVPSLLMAMQAQKGIPAFKEDGTSNLGTSENIENVYYLRQLCRENRVCRINEAPAYQLLGREKAAMIYGWSWVANDLKRNYPTLDYGFFRIPVWDDRVPPAYEYHNYEVSFGINAQLDEEKSLIAQDLLLFYLCNDEVLIRTAKQAQIVPSKKSLVSNYAGQLGEVITSQAGYIDRTAFKGAVPDAVYTYFGSMVNTNLLDESTSISEQLHKADEEITRLLQIYEFHSALSEYTYYNEFDQ